MPISTGDIVELESKAFATSPSKFVVQTLRITPSSASNPNSLYPV
ncbi:hypothetical protein DSM3645_02893 [Blastopirellula marina DSM 3645]|uniref:Uncharacterized protein n=1 Tax=Blastopirellula marina DSM 3645 TaxID=314230 RepID=A3ZVP2_9BACT|nr:hypothetical protein DSM3645_02893 [Blastopirellula marina DSM 3645]